MNYRASLAHTVVLGLTGTLVGSCGLFEHHGGGGGGGGPSCLTTGDLSNIQNWTYTGTTMYSADQNALLITTDDTYEAGSAFQTSNTTPGNDINIAFEFLIDDGNGADGFALVALDSSQQQTNLLGGSGCGMGFADATPCCCTDQGACSQGQINSCNVPPLPGWAVEFDTFYNQEVDQTTSPHIAFAINGDLQNEPFWAAVPDLRGDWHTMSITVDGFNVTASIDGIQYLSGTVTQDLSFPAWVGFTGSTGADTDNHFIRGLTVTSAACGLPPMAPDGGVVPADDDGGDDDGGDDAGM